MNIQSIIRTVVPMAEIPQPKQWLSVLKYLIVCTLCLPTIGNAHHSFGAFYDMSKLVEVEGEVVSVVWRNPHIRFKLKATDELGGETIWDMEAGSLNTLQRNGVGKDALQVGETLRVSGPASLHGLDTMFAVSINFANGEEVILNPNLAARLLPNFNDPRANELAIADELIAESRIAAQGIFRVWVPVSRPVTGSGLYVWPLTPEGQAAKDSWDPLTDDPALKCIPPGIPVAMDNPYPFEFTNQDDTIIMRLEEWDGVRTIYMTPRPAPPELTAPHMGYSVGSWEDNTLVVTTTGIDYPFFDDVGSPQSPAATVVEHFTLSENDTRLDWTARVTDPMYYSEPVTLSGHWAWSPGTQIKRYECTL
ncbi:MAG: hypothetical protein HOJ88_01520 [Proteobacteria bacterium]|jgi:hypothetical protein|nr:hypothetical protein [Pseudomonadota bacterium]